MRYSDIKIKTGHVGHRSRQVITSVIYPPIPTDASDIYLLTTAGDRMDVLSKKYYGSVGYWWVIAEANAVGKGSMVLHQDVYLRIPTNLTKIINDYNKLNK